MNKTELINKVSRTFNRAAFKLKKHSPEILVVAGVAGVVGSTVMACKATTKLDMSLTRKPTPHAPTIQVPQATKRPV